MNLRPYQQRSLDNLHEWWSTHPGANEVPICCLPTASGKSVVIAELARLLFDTYPEAHPRTVVIVPSKELAEQNAEKLRAILPSHLSVGYYSASLGRKVPDADVIVATIGSIYRDALLLGNIMCVVIDECFTGDTLISTPIGAKRIESISVGDEVFNATGLGRVTAISKRDVSQICNVRLSNGTELRTTDNHPFFTANGWKKASELAQGEGVICIQDMPILWDGISSVDKGESRWDGSESVSQVILEGKVLLNILLKEAGERDVGSWGQREDVNNLEENSAQAIATWWERMWNDRASKSTSFDFAEWVDSRICNQDRNSEEGENVSNLLQSGHRESREENCDRTGREFTLRDSQTTGRKEGLVSGFVRVESVAREKLSSIEPVYNLQVGGHPSYFANGVLVHNCHLVNPDGAEAGRYRKFLNDLSKVCDYRVVGYTATPFRGNGVWLTDGEQPLFTGIACSIKIQELLDLGFLSPLVRPVDDIKTRIDTDDIKTTSGDFNLADLSDRVDQYLPAVVDEACELAAERKKWIAFCATVVNAQQMVDLMRAKGIATELVTGDTPKVERQQHIKDYRAGRVRCLVTVLALAVGFDVPDVDCIIWARPTKSPVLYVQGAGRGMRIADGKTDCLWLDFSDTTERMGPVDTIRGRTKRKGSDEDGVAPTKTCGECGEVVSAGVRVCPCCGHEFPATKQQVREASNAAIMASQIASKVVTYDINRVAYGIHQKPGKPDSLRVEYYAGYRRVAQEWICFEHGGFAGEKARLWWSRRCGENAATSKVALDIIDLVGIKEPKQITVDERGDFPNITGYKWEVLEHA